MESRICLVSYRLHRFIEGALTPPPVAGADPELGPDEIWWSDSDPLYDVRRDLQRSTHLWRPGQSC